MRRRRVVLAGMTASAGLVAANSRDTQSVAQEPTQSQQQLDASTGRLTGKVALVTGAARGIGQACAVTLAQQGANIIICDIAQPIATTPYELSNIQNLQETKRLVEQIGRRCIAVQADVRNIGQMRELVDRGVAEFGKIDILIANAGILSFSTLEQMTDEQWRDMIDVDLTGTGNSMRAVIPHMVSRRSGRIVAISSDLGRRGGAGVAHYVAAKWGVIGLVKSAALELARNNITVNAISPGLTRTGMSQNLATYRFFRPDLENPTVEDVRPAVIELNTNNNELPIAWLEPDDIANGVVYLVSDEGRYVTGVALDITAGKNSHYTA